MMTAEQLSNIGSQFLSPEELDEMASVPLTTLEGKLVKDTIESRRRFLIGKVEDADENGSITEEQAVELYELLGVNIKGR